MNQLTRLDAPLDEFRSGLAWILPRKDFNDFWPIGIPEAGTGGAGVFIEQVEDPILHSGEDCSVCVPNPTALVTAFLYAIHGMRENNWSRDRRLRFADALLRIIARSKKPPIPGKRASHRLATEVRESVPSEAWIEVSSRGGATYASAAHRLSGTIWAYAEALCFFNHRVCTERHGPYESDTAGEALLVRSAYNLTPKRVWPELDEWPALPQAVEIAGVYRDAEAAAFDLFANPLFTFDVNRAAVRLAVGVREHAVWHWQPASDRLSALSDQLVTVMDRSLRIISGLSSDDLSRKVYLIMLEASRQVAGAAEPASVDSVTAGRRLAGSTRALLDYYDVREEKCL